VQWSGGSAQLIVMRAGSHGSQSITVTVPSTAGPWAFGGALNPGYAYGVNDQTPPVVVSSADGFSLGAGDSLVVTYLSGLTNCGGCSVPPVDGIGIVTAPTNNDLDNGYYFPSKYIPSGQYPVNLMTLVGVFTDSGGAIVGVPQKIGNGPTTVVVPAGAAQLQLGINDIIFRDNTGSLLIQVTGPRAAPGLLVRRSAAAGDLRLAVILTSFPRMPATPCGTVPTLSEPTESVAPCPAFHRSGEIRPRWLPAHLRTRSRASPESSPGGHFTTRSPTQPSPSCTAQPGRHTTRSCSSI
jgi:hypothetical protein